MRHCNTNRSGRRTAALQRSQQLLGIVAGRLTSQQDAIIGSEFSLGTLDFKNASPGSINTTLNWSTLISESNDLAINNVENFDVLSSVPIFSFGFDIHEPTTTTPPLRSALCQRPRIVDPSTAGAPLSRN